MSSRGLRLASEPYSGTAATLDEDDEGEGEGAEAGCRAEAEEEVEEEGENLGGGRRSVRPMV